MSDALTWTPSQSEPSRTKHADRGETWFRLDRIYQPRHVTALSRWGIVAGRKGGDLGSVFIQFEAKDWAEAEGKALDVLREYARGMAALLSGGAA